MFFHKRIFLITLLFYFGMSSPATAQENSDDSSEIPLRNEYKPGAKLETHPDLKEGKLPNGLRYFILKNAKSENRVELRLLVEAGSLMESDEQQGLAHFVEHMAFNGTENFPKSDLVDYLESIGMRFGPDINAYTTFDKTVYKLQSRSDEDSILRKSFQILADWSCCISFDELEVEKERGVVLSELRSGLSPQQRMQENYLPILYHKSRYSRRLPIGQKNVVSTASLETIKSYYREWYRPELMSVIVVGDIEPDHIESLISEFFLSLKRPSTTIASIDESMPYHKETFVSINADSEAAFSQVRLINKHKSVKLVDEQTYKNQLANELFNRMLNKRLESKARSDSANFIFAFSGIQKDLGDLELYTSLVSTADNELLQGFKDVLTENERLLRFGFTEREQSLRSESLLDRYEKIAIESNKLQSRRLASQLISYADGSRPFLGAKQEYLLVKKLLPLIKLNELNGIASNMMTDENRVIISTSIQSEDLVQPSEQDFLQIMKEVRAMDLSKLKEEEAIADLFPSFPSKGVIVKKLEDVKTGIISYELSNGMKVNLKPTDFKNEEVLMQAYSPGGYSSYPVDDYIEAEYASYISSESGLGDFSRKALEEYLIGKQISLQAFISEYSEGLTGKCETEDIETMFQMIHLSFTSARFEEVAFNSFIKKQQAFFKNITSNASYYFMDYSDKFKWLDNAKAGFPSSEQIGQIDYNRCKEIYEERFADAGDFTLSFVGNVSVPKFESMIEIYLASLETANESEEVASLPFKYKPGINKTKIVKGKSEKSQVELFYHGAPLQDSISEYVFHSMISILNIKLRERLREEMSAVYGVQISPTFRKSPDPLYAISISFNAEPSQEDELISAIRGEILELQTSGSNEEHLIKITAAQLESLKLRLKENNFWLQAINACVKRNRGFSKIGLENANKLANDLDAEMVKSAAQHYFSDQYFEIVMVPEK